MPVDIAARIVSHDPLNPDHFLLTLEAPAIARAARPGQFVMLQVDDGRDPLLRRPMSIARVPPGARRIQVLYKIVGEGTRRLSRQPRGARLATIGPLGNGFTLPARGAGARSAGRPASAPAALLVAGGIGIAIFPFLSEALRKRGVRPVLLFGGRKARDLVAVDLIKARGGDRHFATEDGSRGAKGYVTSILEPMLRGSAPRPLIYACGPTPMLRAVADLAVSAKAPCQLALESQMPCGIGVCLGCVVRCAGDQPLPRFKRVCTEGPVFEAGSVHP